MNARLVLAALLLPMLGCDPPAATTATSPQPSSAPTATAPTATTPTASAPVATVSAPAATVSAPVAGAASAAPTLDSAATADATSAPDPSAATHSDERLSRGYPGARVTHNAGGRHWHSEGWASKDAPAKVRAYYRRYAAQNPGFKLQETADSLSLDGGGAMGLITVRAASSSDKLEPGERTVISSSRP